MGLPLEPGVYSLEYLESANTKILEALPCRQLGELDVGSYRSWLRRRSHPRLTCTAGCVTRCPVWFRKQFHNGIAERFLRVSRVPSQGDSSAGSDAHPDVCLGGLSFFFLFFKYFIFNREREREREKQSASRARAERERGRHRIRSRLQAPSCQPRARHGARTHRP